MGLAFGTYSAPFFGALFGPLFLASPLAYAAAGSYETMCGAAAIYTYNLSASSRWRRHVRKLITQQQRGRTQVLS